MFELRLTFLENLYRQRWVKVSETKTETGLQAPGDYICDFCSRGYDLLWSLNDGLWAVCTLCMNKHFPGDEEE
jgi:hypothetical protein